MLVTHNIESITIPMGTMIFNMPGITNLVSTNVVAPLRPMNLIHAAIERKIIERSYSHASDK